MESITVAIIIAIIIAISWKPARKATGLVLIFLGILTSLSGIGCLIGIPVMLVGGILLFA